jgi:septum formation protein
MARRPRFVLGSSSPRRLELLARIGVVPDDIRPAEIDEDPRPGEAPLTYCRRIAQEKSAAVSLADGEVVLAADTTVALGRRIMGKPADEDEARNFLGLMSGRRHRVITVIAVRSNDRQVMRDVSATVRMRRLTDPEISAYIESGEWQGKAGAYAIQGAAEAFVPWIRGSYSAIVGLPLSETKLALRSFGVLPKARP